MLHFTRHLSGNYRLSGKWRILQRHTSRYFTHSEQGILKTVQCTVLPCEVSERNRSRDAVTEAAAFLTAAENTAVHFTFPSP